VLAKKRSPAVSRGTESELSRIVNILIDNYNPLKVILFGSLANGEIHDYSDIDLIVIKESDKSFFTLR